MFNQAEYDRVLAAAIAHRKTMNCRGSFTGEDIVQEIYSHHANLSLLKKLKLVAQFGNGEKKNYFVCRLDSVELEKAKRFSYFWLKNILFTDFDYLKKHRARNIISRRKTLKNSKRARNKHSKRCSASQKLNRKLHPERNLIINLQQKARYTAKKLAIIIPIKVNPDKA